MNNDEIIDEMITRLDEKMRLVEEKIGREEMDRTFKSSGALDLLQKFFEDVNKILDNILDNYLKDLDNEN